MIGWRPATRVRRAGAVALGVVALASVPAAGSESGARLAASAIEAMGGAAAVAALETLDVTADCNGPGGAFTSTVHWQRGGATTMSQSDDTGSRTLTAVGERAWSVDPDSGGRTELPGEMAAMVHGHAVHPILFRLDTGFREHRAAGTGENGCLRVEMVDEAGRPASVCLDPATRLPQTYTFTPAGPGGEIEMRLSGWRRIGELMYFGAFDLRQGEERFRWVYSTIRPNRMAGPPAAAGDRPLAGAWRPGDRISLGLKNAALPDVLQSFARMAGFNLVLDPSVSGSVTVELHDVPWEQALETILESHGLAAEVDGAAWRVRQR